MLDIRDLRQQGEEFQRRLAIKGYSLDLDTFAALDKERKSADVRSQELQAARNKAAKKVGELIQSGMNVEQAKAEVAESLASIDKELAQEAQRAQAVQQRSEERRVGKEWRWGRGTCRQKQKETETQR